MTFVHVERALTYQNITAWDFIPFSLQAYYKIFTMKYGVVGYETTVLIQYMSVFSVHSWYIILKLRKFEQKFAQKD